MSANLLQGSAFWKVSGDWKQFEQPESFWLALEALLNKD